MHRAVVLSVLLLVLLPLAVSAGDVDAPATTDAGAPGAQYVCPMSEHTQVFDHPGKCPLCGMELVERVPANDRPALPPLGDAGPPYICPMPGHTQLYDKPGVCPICHMPLVSRGALARKSVAILIWDGVQILDYTAPYEVFGQAGFHVFTVAPEKRPVTTAMGMKVMPDYPLGAAPAAEIVVVPGGDVNLADRRIVEWLKQRADRTETTLAISNGVFWLARAALLDGLDVATFPGLGDELRAAAPLTRVVAGARFVDSGRIVTAAGLAASLDGALRVLERTVGRERAAAIAARLQVDWHPATAPAPPPPSIPH